MNTFSTSLCRAHIHLDRIRRNFRRAGEARRLLPVVKSDAYGHGLLPVARALAECGAQSFAVRTVSEALALRAEGHGDPAVGGAFCLALLGAPTPREMAQAAAADIVPLVYDQRGLELAAAHGSLARPLRIAVKWDTGMARLGFSPEDASELIERLSALPGLQPTLCMSHLACADTPGQDAFTNKQIQIFSDLVQLMRRFPGMRATLANSAGALGHPRAAFDLARPGIVLYGGNPFHGTARSALGAELENALDVGAPVLQIRGIRAGESVGYGRAFTAPRDMRIGIVGVGYAAGYTRAFSNRGQLVLRGKRVAVLGRVCMDMIAADLGATPDAQVGDTAWLLGGPEPDAITVHELADAWGTISYEVLCLLGRNTRSYGGGS
ncbi:MAG: alanine racemase [Deltaproteobacteria bacterium]|jgi:alanine racemase|nr:alanine racemase [Deltaproteobacteria bacterium]